MVAFLQRLQPICIKRETKDKMSRKISKGDIFFVNSFCSSLVWIGRESFHASIL